MIKSQFFIYLITSFLSSWYLIKICIPLFKKNWTIFPNQRTSHIFPKPFGGGLIFSFISIFAASLNFEFVPFIFLPIIIIGHLDDCHGISPFKRLFVQLGNALILITYKSKVSLLGFFDFNGQNYIFQLMMVLILIFIFTAFVNIVNFADGIDGLVSSSFIPIFITAFIKLPNQEYLIFLIGALLGFLYWNWNPSKIFMGDSGSYFLGAIYFSIIINTRNIEELICFLLLGIPIFTDILVTLIRRFVIGENIFKPHKLNLYQRLNQSGLNHAKVSLIYLLSTSLLCSSYIIGGLNPLLSSSIIILIIGYFLNKYIALDFQKTLTNSKRIYK